MPGMTGRAAERLLELRRAAGLSQMQLAQLLGVSNATVSFWEAGKSALDTNDLEHIAILFTIPGDVLVNSDQGPFLDAIRAITERRLEGRLNLRYDPRIKEAITAAAAADRSRPFAGARELALV